MVRLADFCRVKLLTYAVMGNHFHALVEVPKRVVWLERFGGAEGETRLFEHLRVHYSKTYVDALREKIAEWRRMGLESIVTLKLEAIKDCDSVTCRNTSRKWRNDSAAGLINAGEEGGRFGWIDLKA
jgi:hypothetical protein